MYIIIITQYYLLWCIAHSTTGPRYTVSQCQLLELGRSGNCDHGFDDWAYLWCITIVIIIIWFAKACECAPTEPQPVRPVPDFFYPGVMEDWGDLGGWLYTEIVYLSAGYRPGSSHL